MPTPLHDKSTLDQIRERFDQDVERFSKLETGQTATQDAPLAMRLITQLRQPFAVRSRFAEFWISGVAPGITR